MAESSPPPLPTTLPLLPWGHHLALLEKVKDPKERLWYGQQAVAHGWSRAVLVHQVETDLYRRQGAAINNFASTLPAVQSDLARELLKDPYNLEFLMLAPDALERDLETGLIERIRDFLLELGTGFSFLGSQYYLEIGGEDFYLDLLFYHVKLRCFVVIDLKIDKFQPEHAGKMAFYLSVVDDKLRHPTDQPSIGIILCKTRNEVIAEYALRDSTKPMGVSTYRVSTKKVLPAELQRNLPRLEDLEILVARADETRRLLATLPPREEKALRLKFGIGGPAPADDETIARELGIDVAEAHAVVETALAKLRARRTNGGDPEDS